MVMAPSVITTEDICVNDNFYHCPKDPKLTLDTDHGVNAVSLPRASAAAKQLVLDVLRKRVADIDVATCEPGEEDAFYVADLGEVYRQHLRWKLNMSRVKPFYGEQ